MEPLVLEEIPRTLVEAIVSGRCVAFVGAGFSMSAGLPTWWALLDGVVRAVQSNHNLISSTSDPKRRLTLLEEIATLLQKATGGEGFDTVAQLLEDNIGSKKFEELVGKQLEIKTSSLCQQMQKRLALLDAIPFRAILTTNYDALLRGPTPADPHCPHSEVLRPAEVTSPKQWADVSGTGAPLKCLESKPTRPVIKLHGSVKESGALESSLVLTRKSYRNLVYHTPGYTAFMRSVMSTCTVLYLGCSFSDGYINELRSEVLSMLYGSGSPSSPIGYAVVANKNKSECDFFLRHEGVKILSWATSRDPTFSGLDQYMARIMAETSFQYRIGEVLSKKRLLILGYPEEASYLPRVGLSSRAGPRGEGVGGSSGGGAGAGGGGGAGVSGGGALSLQASYHLREKLTSAVEEYQREHPEADKVTVISVCDVVSALTHLQDEEQQPLPFDVVISVYGEAGEGDGAGGVSWWRQLSSMMQSPEFEEGRRAPLIVFSTATGESKVKRRKECLTRGCYDFVSSLHELVESLARLLEPSKGDGKGGRGGRGGSEGGGGGGVKGGVGGAEEDGGGKRGEENDSSGGGKRGEEGGGGGGGGGGNTTPTLISTPKKSATPPIPTTTSSSSSLNPARSGSSLARTGSAFGLTSISSPPSNPLHSTAHTTTTTTPKAHHPVAATTSGSAHAPPPSPSPDLLSPQSLPSDTMPLARVLELMRGALTSSSSTPTTMRVLKEGARALMSIAGGARQGAEACSKEGAVGVLVKTLELGAQRGDGGVAQWASGALWQIAKFAPQKCISEGAVAALEAAAALPKSKYNAEYGLKTLGKRK